MSIVTDFRKIERTCCQPVCIKMTCVNEKVSPLNRFTSVTNCSICKARKNWKKINKAYYGENENVTLVNIFVGGTFPFQQGIFMQS